MHAAALKLLTYLARCRGLTRAGGAGHQDDGAYAAVFNDFLRRVLHAACVHIVALLDEALGVGDCAEIDFFKIKCHYFLLSLL